MAGEKLGKLVPTNEEGKSVELNENQKLMAMTKAELVEKIEADELKHKKLLTRSKNLKEASDETQAKIEKLENELAFIKAQQEDTHEEAAQMSETIRIKNRVIDEVTEAYLALANVTRTSATQGLKILEYNGLVSNPNPRKGRE